MAEKFKYEVKAKQNRQMLPAEQSKLLLPQLNKMD